jgi:diadenosine tetraphosphate (Ap4A) HIT family hydrolase
MQKDILVIPKQEIENFFDLNDALRIDVFKKVAAVLEKQSRKKNCMTAIYSSHARI